MKCLGCGKELRLLYREGRLYCSDHCKRVIERRRVRLKKKEEKHCAKKSTKEKNVTRWSVYLDPRENEDGFSKGAVIPSIEQTLLDGNLNPGTILRKNKEFYLVCGVLGHSQSLTKIAEVQVEILVTSYRSSMYDRQR